MASRKQKAARKARRVQHGRTQAARRNMFQAHALLKAHKTRKGERGMTAEMRRRGYVLERVRVVTSRRERQRPGGLLGVGDGPPRRVRVRFVSTRVRWRRMGVDEMYAAGVERTARVSRLELMEESA